MGKRVYLTSVSLDLLIEDEHGILDLGAGSDELFVHSTNLIRPLGTHLHGRRLDETTAPWETSPELAAELAGIWAAASRGTSR